MSNEASAVVRGILLVVSSPSGAGKTTLCNRLRAEFPRLGFSVSYTTRAPRGNERDGVEYHFVDKAAFDEMANSDRFAEYAIVHGNMYGTAKAPVQRSLDDGTDLLFDVDFQGSRSLKQSFPNDVVRVFILPPSMEELERRLRNRATDTGEVIERRLRMARAELEHFEEYEFVVLNDNIDRAYDVLRGIYLAQLHRVERMKAQARAILSGPTSVD